MNASRTNTIKQTIFERRIMRLYRERKNVRQIIAPYQPFRHRGLPAGPDCHQRGLSEPCLAAEMDAVGHRRGVVFLRFDHGVLSPLENQGDQAFQVDAVSRGLRAARRLCLRDALSFLLGDGHCFRIRRGRQPLVPPHWRAHLKGLSGRLFLASAQIPAV